MKQDMVARDLRPGPVANDFSAERESRFPILLSLFSKALFTANRAQLHQVKRTNALSISATEGEQSVWCFICLPKAVPTWKSRCAEASFEQTLMRSANRGWARGAALPFSLSRTETPNVD
jgi:hypothetical protein